MSSVWSPARKGPDGVLGLVLKTGVGVGGSCACCGCMGFFRDIKQGKILGI